MQRAIATFTLDTGQCPRWLFARMVKLGRQITEVLINEYGPDEFIARIADPVWFQSLGTVLAFDWNASGLTTILTTAFSRRPKPKRYGIVSHYSSFYNEILSRSRDDNLQFSPLPFVLLGCIIPFILFQEEKRI